MASIFSSIRINLTGETIPSRYWHWNSDAMPDYDLVILQRGKATYTDGETSWQVSPGSCMLFRRFASYSGVQEPDNPVAMIFIHFDFLDSRRRPVTLPPAELLPVHFRIERFDFVTSLARSVLDANRENGAHPAESATHSGRGDKGRTGGENSESNESGEVGRLWLRALWTELQRQLSQPRWQGSEREQRQQIESVCNTIRNRIGEPWRLSDIAAALHCGPEHAGRLFRKYKGVSPGEFVIRTRIEAAQALLGSSSQNITQIADTLGFCDVYAFSRQFRQRTGLSPREFRS